MGWGCWRRVRRIPWEARPCSCRKRFPRGTPPDDGPHGHHGLLNNKYGNGQYRLLLIEKNGGMGGGGAADGSLLYISMFSTR